MNRLLKIGLAFSVLLTAVPTSTKAENILYINNGLPYSYNTEISGDADQNGELNIADAVIFESYILKGKTPENMRILDLNLDGSVDIFDFACMRKQLLTSGKALSRNYAVDIVNAPTDTLPTAKIIADSATLAEYLSAFITDKSEISTYSEKYNDEFFKENNIILCPFFQERGRGIFYDIEAVRRENGGICLDIASNYTLNLPIYPITNTTILIQATLPKLQCSENDKIIINNMTAIDSEISSHSYFSPDGTKELYITQQILNNLSDVRIYLRMQSNSLAPLGFADVTGGFRPFNDNGEWSADSEGNPVFSDGKNFSIAWYDDYVIIEHEKGDGTRESFQLELAPQEDIDRQK